MEKIRTGISCQANAVYVMGLVMLSLSEFDLTTERRGFDDRFKIGKSERDIDGEVYEGSQRMLRHAIVISKNGTRRDVKSYPRKVRQEIEMAILEQT